MRVNTWHEEGELFCPRILKTMMAMVTKITMTITAMFHHSLTSVNIDNHVHDDTFHDVGVLIIRNESTTHCRRQFFLLMPWSRQRFALLWHMASHSLIQPLFHRQPFCFPPNSHRHVMTKMSHHTQGHIAGDVGDKDDDRGGSEAPRRLHPHRNCSLALTSIDPTLWRSCRATGGRNRGFSHYHTHYHGAKASFFGAKCRHAIPIWWGKNLLAFGISLHSTTCAAACPMNRCSPHHHLPIWLYESRTSFLSIG